GAARPPAMASDDALPSLERGPTLGLLGRPALRIWAMGAETRHVDDGEVLFNAGDEAEGGFVVQAGRFQLSSSGDGKDLTVGPCTLLGEGALFARTKRPAAAQAPQPPHRLSHPPPPFLH